MSRFIIFQTNAEYYSAPWEIAKNNYSLDDYRAVYCEVIIDEIQRLVAKNPISFS